MQNILFLILVFYLKENLSENVNIKVNSLLQIQKTEIFCKNGSSRVTKDFIKTLLDIQKVSPQNSNCSLIRLCTNRNNVVPQGIIQEHPAIKNFLLKLFSRKLSVSSNDNKNNLNKKVNKDTNFIDILCNKENAAIANCSGNSQTPTINGETVMINFQITGDSIKRLLKGYYNMPLKPTTPTPYVEARNLRARDKKITSANITKISRRISGLQFLDVPKGDEMRIHSLRLEEEYLLFEVFSNLMGYLQLAEFPTDLIRDALENHIPFYLFALQLFKMETTAIGWILIWIILSVSIPIVATRFLCCGKSNQHHLDEDTSDSNLDSRARYRRCTLAFLLNFLLIVTMIPIIFIFIGNEQISRQMARSVTTTNLIFDDLNTFVKNTHMQISFVATTSTDITIEIIRKDLEDIGELLGRPFQNELTAETGIDIAFEALEELKLTSSEVSSVVVNLLDECKLANEARNSLQEQLREVFRQLTIARQQCRLKDRALCYTLEYTGLDVTFSCENLSKDPKIKHLEHIEKDKSFNNSVETARIRFTEIPKRVCKNTASHITELKNLLTRKRSAIYKATHSLFELSATLTTSIKNARRDAIKVVEMLSNWDFWRWLSVLGISTLLSLAWGLLLCGTPCGYAIIPKKIPFLLTGIVCGSFLCLLIWSLGTLSFLFGGHGQTLLCQPLYDHPHYKALGEILNSGGILYKESGFFKEFLRRNDSLKIEDVLLKCHGNMPVYVTFHLNNIFDAKTVTNYKTWNDFKSIISNLTIGENSIEILSPTLEFNLQMLSSIPSVNFSLYRTKISAPLMRKDLNSFADQLNTVARQLKDPASSKRFDNLALMVRKIFHHEMARLNDLKDRILYKITALDVLIQPMNNKANQSLSHLKSIQFFLDNQLRQIADRITGPFALRLEGYLEDLYTYIITKVTKEIGKCKPLWEIFDSTRFCICKLIVDPMNGISISSFSLILLFLSIIPAGVILVNQYRGMREDILTSISHRRARDGLIIDDEGTWASPSSETPMSESNNGQAEQLWSSPHMRQSSETLIPVPPRMPQIPLTSRLRSPNNRLSTIASRISTARVSQIPSISRARTPKRERNESIRLIETIRWNSGSLTPKSWL